MSTWRRGICPSCFRGRKTMAKKEKKKEPEAVVEPPFDSVIVSQVPICEEKTGCVIEMQYFNAAG